MPSGKVHAAAAIVLTAVVPGILYYYGLPLKETLTAGMGCLTGLVLTPDLDVDSGSISQSNVNHYGGSILGLVWAVLWKPYALLIHHRSFLSHAPLVGTAIRLIYVTIVPWLVWMLINQSIPGIPAPLKIDTIPPIFWWFAGGLAVSDFAHFIMDKIFRKRFSW